MFRNLWWLALGAGAFACSEWPRFVHPSQGVEPYSGQVGVGYQLSELDVDPLGDAPDQPTGIIAGDPRWFDQPYLALQVDGQASPVATLVGRPGDVPFEQCANQAEPPVEGYYYDGDVDFYRVANPLGTLCFVLRTQAYTAGRKWDVIAYEYDEASDCITGDFLTQRSVDDPNTAAYIVEGGWNSLTSTAKDIAFYVAGSNGGGGDDMQYSVYVYPTHFARVCETLDPDQFVPIQGETP